MSSLVARFTERFGKTPRLFRAPGRINIIGEHTDYAGGFAMPAAIDRWCTVAAAANGTRQLRVFASAFECEVAIELDNLKPRGDWSDYVAGVAAILAEAGIAVSGADLAIESNVPIGAGVSSSAALEVATALALLALAGREAAPLQIAQWCQAAENRFVGMPCGILDQFASLHGRAGHAMLLDCMTLKATQIPIPRNAAFLVVNSMTKHALVEGKYKERRQELEEAFADVTIEALRKDFSPRLLLDLPLKPAKRACHVGFENQRVHKSAAAMKGGNLRRLGQLLNESHNSLRVNMEVTTPELDKLASVARWTWGVRGARMMGGGFGGSIIALVDAKRADRAKQLIARRYGTQIGKEPDAFVCRAVDGASEVPV